MLTVFIKDEYCNDSYGEYYKTYYGEEAEKIFSGHRWVWFGVLQMDSICGAILMPGSKTMQICDNRGIKCFYSEDDHMIRDIIC